MAVLLMPPAAGLPAPLTALVGVAVSRCPHCCCHCHLHSHCHHLVVSCRHCCSCCSHHHLIAAAAALMHRQQQQQAQQPVQAVQGCSPQQPAYHLAPLWHQLHQRCLLLSQHLPLLLLSLLLGVRS